MIDYISAIFKDLKIDKEKLISYGFKYDNEIFSYSEPLEVDDFILNITIDDKDVISTSIIDLDFNELYTMHLDEGATGKFVGTIKALYEEKLKDIASKCFISDVYKSKVVEEIISYVKREYGDIPEFLWKSNPTYSVFRRSNNRKWYGVIMKIPENKLGLSSDNPICVINLKVEPNKLLNLIDNKRYFPTFHMNKKNWCTIILDESTPLDKINKMIDESYYLALKG